MTRMRKMLAASLSFALVIAAALFIAAPAYADGVDYAFGGLTAADLAPGKTGSISLDYDNDALTGAQVDLYRIADVNTQGFTFTSQFKPYVNDIEWLKDADGSSMGSDWDIVAETLSGHALADGVEPLQTATTAQGKVQFTNLPAGLYMMKAHNITINEMVYMFSPMIVALPTPGVDGGAATYDVQAEPKSTDLPVKDRRSRSFKIVKHWVPAEGSDAVATVTSITVQLLRDGVAWGDPIELSDKNQWSYAWEDTEGTHEWSASEQAINGSSVVWSRQVTLTSDDVSGNVIVLTNTEVTEKPPHTPPSNPPSTPPTTKQRLPKTGETWLPVPILLVGAFAVLGVSRAMRLRGRRSDNT